MPNTDSVFDRTTVLHRLGGDLSLYGSIAHLFLNHYPGELETLKQALAAGDAGTLHRTAHSLKGAISNFAAERAIEAARTLEFAHKAGNLAENADALVADTIAAVEEFAMAIRADLEASKLSPESR